MPKDHYVIKMLPIAELQGDPDNPFDHSDAEIARLVGSLQEHGYLEPVVFNQRTGHIVGGHARVEAARLVGRTHVPAVVVDFDETQEAAANLALNGPYGRPDDARLADMLRALDTADYDLDFTGLEPWKIDDLLHPGQSKTPQATDSTGATITAEIHFDNEEQQANWFRFGKWLSIRYPDCMTLAEKLHNYAAEVAS